MFISQHLMVIGVFFCVCIIKPVGESEQDERKREQNPGGDINLLGIETVMINPAKQSIFCLLQTRDGGHEAFFRWFIANEEKRLLKLILERTQRDKSEKRL